MAACYLLHFSVAYPNGNRPQHYLGYAKNLPKRLAQHRLGKGARLTEVITQAGIRFEVARVWPNGSPQLERELKRRHRHRDYCPLCQQATTANTNRKQHR
jgi:predicted GIY-YIG superfamily endonuclease